MSRCASPKLMSPTRSLRRPQAEKNVAPGNRPRRSERLYVGAAVAVAALVFAGFARSYYLRAFLPARDLTPLIHLHGVLMTGWIVLFATQAFLIRKRRIDVHRRAGVLGAALVPAIVIVGSLTAAAAIQRRFPGIGLARFTRIFIEFDGLGLWLFGVLALIAILCRSRPDVHKRLMLSATVALLPPAVGRIAEHLHFVDSVSLLAAAVTTCTVILVCTAADTARRGSIHPAMAYGAVGVLAANVLTQLSQLND